MTAAPLGGEPRMHKRDAPDYYAVLGVDRGADARALKDAFRKLTLRFHPDKNKDPRAVDRYKEIAAAYAVLGDPAKRAEYDARGRSAETYSTEDLLGGVDLGDWLWSSGFGGDWVERLFGTRFGPPRGKHVELVLDVDLESVAAGRRERVKFKRPSECLTCHGTGYQPVSKKSSSPASPGRLRCVTCRGSGIIEIADEAVIDIPPGIEDGTVLRVPEKGGAAPSGRRGDLLVVIRSKPHPIFSRSGADLHTHVEVSVPDAALGAKVPVRTLRGQVEVNVPAGTQPGTLLRLRGEGLPRLAAARPGDLLVRVNVRIPVDLRDEDRHAFEAMRRRDHDDSLRG